MNFFQKEFTFDRVVRIILIALLVWILFYALDYFSEVLIPFFVALVFAYLLNPFFNFLQKIFKLRIIALFIGFLIFVGGIYAIISFLFPIILKQVDAVFNLLQKVFVDFDWKVYLNKFLPEDWAKKIITLVEKGKISELLTESQIEKLSEFGFNQVSNLLSYIKKIALFVVGATFFLIYMFFILLNFNEVQNLWQSLIPPIYRPRVLKVLNDLEVALNKYFRGQVLIAFITIFLYSIGFMIIKLPLGLLLGIITGILVLIPYMHNLSIPPALILSVLGAYQSHSSYLKAILYVLIVFAVVQIIIDFVLVPLIMKNATGLNPAIILLSLSLWGKLLGILGLIIALPLTYLILGYYTEFIVSIKMEGPGKLNLNEEVDFDYHKIPGEL